MKDSLNFFLPIMEDDTNRNEFKNITSISSNGYYGYQPVMEKSIHSNGTNNDQSMDIQMNDSNIQFNNLIPVENINQDDKNTNNNRGQFKRKRHWDYDYETEYPEFKKYRETQEFIDKEKARNYGKNIVRDEKSLVEDLLRETHGCSPYHWNPSTK